MSKFVSSGTDQEPTEREPEWLEAQKAIEARHLAKIEAGKQQGGKSLYETLQANKDAKQEAFEESIRLKNQFRSLNDDELEFLDSITQAERSKEAEVRREAKAQLEAFKLKQEAAEKAAQTSVDVVEPVATENWSASRKRKKDKDPLGIVKKWRASGTAVVESAALPIKRNSSIQTSPSCSSEKSVEKVNAESSGTPDVKKSLLGLAEYSSDEE